jgi:hypothetical protein
MALVIGDGGFAGPFELFRAHYHKVSSAGESFVTLLEGRCELLRRGLS